MGALRQSSQMASHPSLHAAHDPGDQGGKIKTPRLPVGEQSGVQPRPHPPGPRSMAPSLPTSASPYTPRGKASRQKKKTGRVAIVVLLVAALAGVGLAVLLTQVLG